MGDQEVLIEVINPKLQAEMNGLLLPKLKMKSQKKKKRTKKKCATITWNRKEIRNLKKLSKNMTNQRRDQKAYSVLIEMKKKKKKKKISPVSKKKKKKKKKKK